MSCGALGQYGADISVSGTKLEELDRVTLQCSLEGLEEWSGWPPAVPSA